MTLVTKEAKKFGQLHSSLCDRHLTEAMYVVCDESGLRVCHGNVREAVIG